MWNRVCRPQADADPFDANSDRGSRKASTSLAVVVGGAALIALVGCSSGERVSGSGSAPPTPPITAAPITAAPITAPPITAEPITAAPVTAPPVTAPPVTAPPVTAPPITDGPVPKPALPAQQQLTGTWKSTSDCCAYMFTATGAYEHETLFYAPATDVEIEVSDAGTYTTSGETITFTPTSGHYVRGGVDEGFDSTVRTSTYQFQGTTLVLDDEAYTK
jgi:hypothetical protein